MGTKIVVAGSLNMDLVGCAARIPVVGETVTGHTFLELPGGKGANQAYAAARLGGQVVMLGRIGSDEFGRRMRANLEQVGCDTSGVLATPGCSSGIALIFVDDRGQNSILIMPGANGRFSPEDVEACRDRIRGAGLMLLQLESPMPTVVAAARAARRVGARVILDPAPAQALPEELFHLVDVLTPNETETAVLAGLLPGQLDHEQAIRIARQLQTVGAATVIIKLGDRGCLLVANQEPQLLPAPRVQAVDSTAAGDVFNAALAVALSEGQAVRRACEFANRAAALSVTRRGAQASAPSREEVEALAAL